MSEYWKDTILEAFDDAGIKATDEQVNTVASWVKGNHENYGMAHGHDHITNPDKEEIKNLRQALKREQRSEHCHECSGSGRLTSDGPSHSFNTECHKCRGRGKVYP